MFDLFSQFIVNTGYYLADYRHIIMIVVGCAWGDASMFYAADKARKRKL